MNKEAARKLLKKYALKFESQGIGKQKYPGNELLDNRDSAIAQCYNMLEYMERFIEDGDDVEFARWLGFIQGIFFYDRACTIGRMLNENATIWPIPVGTRKL